MGYCLICDFPGCSCSFHASCLINKYNLYKFNSKLEIYCIKHYDYTNRNIKTKLAESEKLCFDNIDNISDILNRFTLTPNKTKILGIFQ